VCSSAQSSWSSDEPSRSGWDYLLPDSQNGALIISVVALAPVLLPQVPLLETAPTSKVHFVLSQGAVAAAAAASAGAAAALVADDPVSTLRFHAEAFPDIVSTWAA